MGFGGISPLQLLLILAIVLLLFGTKRLRSLGGDLGGAIKGFRKAIKDDNADKPDADKDAAREDAQDHIDQRADQANETQTDEHKQKSDSTR